MWVNNSIGKPLKEGMYKTSVDYDGYGNLIESDEDFFNGSVWDLYKSYGNYIRFWFADKEDYKIITDNLEKSR